MIARNKPDTFGTPGQGRGVDPYGQPVVDPSENVKALSEAANKRQDDLREANDKLIQSQLLGIKETLAMRAEFARLLGAAEARRLDEQAMLRAGYADQLASAEAKRIDAIRAVDVNAVAVASQRTADQATVLANQVAQSAEALRTLVASTAATVAAAQAQLGATLSGRLTTLEQAQYKGEGRSLYADPQMQDLVAQVKTLAANSQSGTGKSSGITAAVGYMIAAVMALVAVAGVLLRGGI